MTDPRHTSTWKHARRKVLDRDSWRCTGCGRFGSSGNRLEVHHIKSVRAGGGDELGNLAALCLNCHIETHREEAIGQLG